MSDAYEQAAIALREKYDGWHSAYDQEAASLIRRHFPEAKGRECWVWVKDDDGVMYGQPWPKPLRQVAESYTVAYGPGLFVRFVEARQSDAKAQPAPKPDTPAAGGRHPMSDERKETLRQVAAVHPKSDMLDECIDEIDRLQAELDALKSPGPKLEHSKIAESLGSAPMTMEQLAADRLRLQAEVERLKLDYSHVRHTLDRLTTAAAEQQHTLQSLGWNVDDKNPSVTHSRAGARKFQYDEVDGAVLDATSVLNTTHPSELPQDGAIHRLAVAESQLTAANARIASLEAEVGFMRNIIGNSYNGKPRLIIIPIAGSFTEDEFLEALSNEIKHGLDPSAVIRAAEAAAKEATHE